MTARGVSGRRLLLHHVSRIFVCHTGSRIWFIYLMHASLQSFGLIPGTFSVCIIMVITVHSKFKEEEDLDDNNSTSLIYRHTQTGGVTEVHRSLFNNSFFFPLESVCGCEKYNMKLVNWDNMKVVIVIS